MDREILKYCLEKGCLIDGEACEILQKLGNQDLAKKVIESLTAGLNLRMITKSAIMSNSTRIESMIAATSGGGIEKIRISLGIDIEMTKESPKEQNTPQEPKKQEISRDRVRVIYTYPSLERKVEIEDFVKHFKFRYAVIKNILQQRTELEGLTSINKIGAKRQNLSIIGAVCEKKTTKNKNIILEVEDPTGRINVLINKDKEELFKIAQEILPDDIIGIKGVGDKEFLFVNELVYPDSYIDEKLRLEEDESVAFISDVHVGSKLFLRDNLLKFIDWINGHAGSEEEREEALKIKYLFIVGDTIDGVGVYPGQEKLLELPDIVEQYNELARLLKMIRKDITMIMCPGQHDSVRVAEPQPPVGTDYGAALHEIENLILVSNPSLIEIGFKKDEKTGTEKRGFRVLMYHGASFHLIINEIDDLRMAKAHDNPTRVMKYLLKRRHLSPVHSFNPYVPHPERDPMVIDIVPDILATGDLHKSDIDIYNNILLIASSCWQATTPFEEKVGNHPDPCKVPVLSLKTRRLRILDFSGKAQEEEEKTKKPEEKMIEVKA
jgi:DNA polymerase II small subunit